MRKALIGAIAIASVITVSSCSKSDSNNSSPSTQASVMFVNGSAGTTPLDVTVNGSSQTAASNLGYLKNSSYINVTAGNDTVALLYHSTGTLFNSKVTSFTAGSSYSVFAGGLINPSTVVVTSDDLSTPASGKAKVRVVNLSPDSLNLTAQVGLTSLVSGLASGTASDFVTISAGTNTMILGDPSNSNSDITLSNQNFASGKIYTIIFTGTMNGSSSVALAATVITNK